MAGSNGDVAVEDVDKAKRKPIPTEIGGTGLRHAGGIIQEEHLRVLSGREGVATYTEMGHDPVVGGVTLAIDNFVRRVEWEVDPPDEEKGKIPGGRKAGNRWADHVHTCMDDMDTSWADTISEIFSMIRFGWSLHEVVPKHRLGYQPPTPGGLPSSDYDDGLVGWARLPIRSQESLLRWEMDDNDRAIGMHQQLLRGARYIALERALLFRTTSAKGNPEGKSVLRSAHRPWYFKRRLEEYEATGIERDLAGLPVGKIPSAYLASDASPQLKAVRDMCFKVVTQVRRNENEGILWPSDLHPDTKEPMFKLELLTSGGSRALDITAAINRKSTEIAMTVLADWILMGHQQVGTQALGSSKIDMFVAALETWTKAVADVFNAHALPQLMILNGVDPRLAPRIRPTRVTQVDAATFVANVAAAVNAGMLTWSDADEDHSRVVLDMPPRDEGLSEQQAQQADAARQAQIGAADGPPAGQGDSGAHDGGDGALEDLPTGKAPGKTPAAA